MKKMIFLLTMLTALVGCSGSVEETVMVCKSETASSISTTYEIEHDSKDPEKIVKIVRTYKAAIADSMFERKSVEELEKLYTMQYINPNEETKGVKYEVSLSKEDKKLTVIASVDAKKADINQLSAMFKINDIENVSKLTEYLKQNGFTCKEVKSNG